MSTVTIAVDLAKHVFEIAVPDVPARFGSGSAFHGRSSNSSGACAHHAGS